jgi:hypothetical protein
MSDVVDSLAKVVSTRLRTFGVFAPREKIIRSLIRIAYLASLRTEEGRFVRGSVTYADPGHPEMDPPPRRRADYPGFTRLGRRLPLTPEAFVKLARAIDKWSGAIAVYGINESSLFAWGVIDQLVGQNVRLNREATSGFAQPGVLTISVDGVGDLSVYHEDFFLGGLDAQQLVTRENDALRSPILHRHVLPALVPLAAAASAALDAPDEMSSIVGALVMEWSNTVARLCIGLRRLGTGGALLITPKPLLKALDITYPFLYQRLSEGVILKVLDDEYLSFATRRELDAVSSGMISTEIVQDVWNAEADAEDRESELSGAAKLVTSLAAVDGLVLLTPTLGVVGFGGKIRSGPHNVTVYDGPAFSRHGTRATKIDLSRFGTRHTSMIRYCRMDPAAIGVVVSQDGYVRLIMTSGRSLTFWDRVKLLNHHDYSAQAALHHRRERIRRIKRRARTPKSLGYTSMPKTIASLLEHSAT